MTELRDRWHIGYQAILMQDDPSLSQRNVLKGLGRRRKLRVRITRYTDGKCEVFVCARWVPATSVRVCLECGWIEEVGPKDTRFGDWAEKNDSIVETYMTDLGLTDAGRKAAKR